MCHRETKRTPKGTRLTEMLNLKFLLWRLLLPALYRHAPHAEIKVTIWLGACDHLASLLFHITRVCI